MVVVEPNAPNRDGLWIVCSISEVFVVVDVVSGNDGVVRDCSALNPNKTSPGVCRVDVQVVGPVWLRAWGGRDCVRPPGSGDPLSISSFDSRGRRRADACTRALWVPRAED